MDVPHEAVLLRIFTGSDDRYGLEEPLYRAIISKAREMNLAGATVLKGPVGYGLSSRMHEPHYFFGKDERPVIIEICDSEEKINAFLPILDDMMESGLVTLEKARVLQYGKKRSSYMERLKKSVHEHMHMKEPPGKPPSGR
jgi:PII-like signaling protein